MLWIIRGAILTSLSLKNRVHFGSVEKELWSKIKIKIKTKIKLMKFI